MSLGDQTEARFYRDFGDHLTEGLPEHYFADADKGTGQGIVTMPDLTASGVRFGHPGTPLTVDRRPTRSARRRPGTRAAPLRPRRG